MNKNGHDKEVEFGNMAIFGIFVFAIVLLAFEGAMVHRAAHHANLVPSHLASAVR